jgi:hypothetical protein
MEKLGEDEESLVVGDDGEYGEKVLPAHFEFRQKYFNGFGKKDGI